ncbi:MAG: 8-oxo-dGTP diphosphatase [Clostridium sp.]|nr:8-oxo-dGTP diphosphatase [Clostridium sp.]
MDRTERVELTALCLVYKEDEILLQDRTKDDWKGYVLPGGHIEKDESIVDAVTREIKEETGLTIFKPELVGLKQFPIKGGRYIVFLFRANKFAGNLRSSNEGKVLWVKREDLENYDLVKDFKELLSVFEDDSLTEFQYILENPEDNDFKMIIK